MYIIIIYIYKYINIKIYNNYTIISLYNVSIASYRGREWA